MTSPDHAVATSAAGGAGGHEKYRPYVGPDSPDRTSPYRNSARMVLC